MQRNRGKHIPVILFYEQSDSIILIASKNIIYFRGILNTTVKHNIINCAVKLIFIKATDFMKKKCSKNPT